MTSDTSGLVVKEVTSRRDLADYFTSFTAGDVSHHAMLAHYVGEEGHGRAAAFFALNCAAKWKPALLAEFRHEQQRKARRGKGRSAYHFVISRRGRTDPKILMAMAKRLLTLAGLDKQKALIAVHTDTDDNHVHIAVSALNDQRRQIILERGYSKVLLAHVNARLCHEFGYKPEAGLGFYATDDGVYRTEDNAKLRDANFCKITNDLRKQPALTARAAAFERETGLPSPQRRIRKSFDRAMGAQSLEMFAAELAVDGITYSLEGSGATIALHEEGFKASRIARSASPAFHGQRGVEAFKASRIARSASPKRIAAHFGVEHMTAPEAQRLGMTTCAGFYRKDEAGVLQPVRLAKAESVTGDEVLPMPGAVTQYRKHQADERLERTIPEATKAQADPLRDRIDFLRARPTPVRNWQCERLERALHYSAGRRGRPPRAQPGLNDPKMPDVELRRDSAIILGPTRHTRWNGPPIWSDVRVKKKGALWHVTRGLQPVATFGPGMIVVHQATPDDKEQIIKLAKLDFASDIQTHCKPADRRSWVRAAQSCDVVLGNIELAKAQTSLVKERQLRLKNLADRLTAQSHRFMKAGKNVLGLTTDALKEVVPMLDKAHARGRERAHALSGRLSVQRELIQHGLAQELLEQRKHEATALHQPQLRTALAPKNMSAGVVPPLRAHVRTTPPESVTLASRQPAEWISTIAEDGTLTWVFPVSARSTHQSQDEQKCDLEKPLQSHQVDSSPPLIFSMPKIDPLSVPNTQQPNEKQPDNASASAPDTNESSLPYVGPPPPERKTAVAEAIQLIQQCDAIPSLEGEQLYFRLLGSDDWKAVPIPADSRAAVEKTCTVFEQRAVAVIDAIADGKVSIQDNGLLEYHSRVSRQILADLRKLTSDAQSLKVLRLATDGQTMKMPPKIAQNAKPPQLLSGLTAIALQKAIKEASSERKAKVAQHAGPVVARADVGQAEDLLQIPLPVSNRRSDDLILRVARQAARKRDFDLRDYAVLKPIFRSEKQLTPREPIPNQLQGGI
ncbi:relaxase/mobilization nuclease domain-containing protein [Pseudopontixanthobacter vadosimaris]|uniref:relaxase/mobilization nuclease domain-containing protein n=1 Tax=Pseudopontixanthobacter vadosimaris TaxID=2726450 RepID=UPI0014741726